MGKGTGKKLAIGTIIAGAVGYVAGLLTAPKSGRETREDIKDAAVNTRAEVEKQLKNLHKEIDVLLGKAKKGSQDLQNKAVTQANAAKETVKNVLTSIRDGAPDDKELKKALKEATDAVNHLKKYVDQHAKNIKESVKK